MLTITSTLVLFFMLGISSLAVFWARRLKLPHTVLLVIIGLGLGILSHLPLFDFINDFKLTPELLFYLLLPTLIFESAYHMNVRKLVADSSIVLALAIGSFLISTLVIAGLLTLALGWIGITIPFIVSLLFGALISATDPVAVLALFKEYGAPKRLSLIFEGESLFNDATAVALFLIVLEIIRQGGLTAVAGLEGLAMFLSMLVLGVLFGLLVGGVFATLIGWTRESEVASITLTIVLAHITFILSELIATEGIFGIVIPVSPIISTTVASLLIGNYGRAKVHPRAERFVAEIWEQFAFMANSLIFILIGVLILQTPIFTPVIFVAIIAAIIIVALARTVSIYSVVWGYNQTQPNAQRIPSSWQHLLAWGSLRGALAITMVFLIPDDLTVVSWNLDISIKEFLLAITIGCIAATLFIKALTIKKLIRHFSLDSFTPIEEMEYQEAKALMHHKVTEQLERYLERGYIDKTIADTLLQEHAVAFTTACQHIVQLSQASRDDLAVRVLRLYAIGIEKRSLLALYEYNEVTEPVFRRIWGKLQIQLEAIEHGNLSPDITLHTDARDVFERLAALVRSVIRTKTANEIFEERYMYYRAQVIISRKVLKELHQVHAASSAVFTTAALQHVSNLYEQFKESANCKLQTLSQEQPVAAKILAGDLAEHSVHTIERSVLNDIAHKELITQKLYIALLQEIKTDTH